MLLSHNAYWNLLCALAVAKKAPKPCLLMRSSSTRETLLNSQLSPAINVFDGDISRCLPETNEMSHKVFALLLSGKRQDALPFLRNDLVGREPTEFPRAIQKNAVVVDIQVRTEFSAYLRLSR